MSLRSLGAALLFFAVTVLPSAARAQSCGGHNQRACCLGEASFGACRPGHTEISGCNASQGNCQCGGGSIFSATSHCIQVTACGGANERACCVGETAFGACISGLTQVPGCSGNCFCSGGIASSSGRCIQTTACGGAGQRACCVGETLNGGNGGGCNAGLAQASGCTGNCTCGGGTGGTSSSSRCVQPTACGGVGQRACCIGERSFGACQAGLTQVPGCGATGDACLCANSTASSSSRCIQTTPCGEPNTRACCVGETLNGGNGGGCDPGLAQLSGCSGVGDCTCGGSTTGAQSSSRCVPVSACGGAGQRACCVGERAGGPCNAGLTEVPGCTTGACLCGGGNGTSSSSMCVVTTACGGLNQRACCVGETVNGGNGGGCNPGLAQVSGCTGVGSCTCGGGTGGTQSSSRCVAVTTCGGEGQRACCVGEGTSGPCGGGLTEVPGCNGNCLCAGQTGASASSSCTATTACGGDGQRACCSSEGTSGACRAGLTEISGCAGNCFCSAGVLGSSSSGTCLATTPCGGDGERACCIGETQSGGNGGGCDTGLIEVSGCQGACECAGGVLGAKSSGKCQPPGVVTACGGQGQRACCTVTGEGTNCQSGLVEVAGCSGNCLCGGNNPTNLGASGTCHRPTPCGAEGQRACCVAERGSRCDPGLIETPGCTGDCFCGASGTGVVDDDDLGTSSGTCIRSPVQQISEPSIGLVSAPPQVCTQLGYADLHMHLFADLAHGGGMMAGHPCPRSATTYCAEAFAGPLAPGGCSTPYCASALDVNSALSACYGTQQDMVTKTGGPLPTPSCPAWLPNCGAKLFHGDHTMFDDPVGSTFGTNDGANLSHLGAPAFSGWPRWSSTTHQQAYYKWLERAWRGGLRLIVQMAVTNTALCITNKHFSGVDCSDSMAFIDQQLQAAYDFESFIDLQVGNGVDTNSGWFRIVKTPAEARAVLAQGKLAVVLGIEVDNLFNCTFPKEQCTYTANDMIASCNMSANTSACRDPSAPTKGSAQYVREQVDRYYDVWGVRHMFPVHNFDNSFGGAATWQDVIEVGNRWVEGHWYNSRDCSSEGYSYKLGSGGTSMQALQSLFGFGQATTVPYHPEAASCNAFGLFPLGRELVDQMMRRGMIVDVDHMSSRAFDDTAALATAFRPGGYPLAASHALFFELNVPSIRHERMRTPAQVAKLRQLNGMVGVMLKDDTVDRDTRGLRSTIDYAPSGVVDDCRHSSKTFAQALAYAVDKVGPAGAGSDFDGVAGHFAPRFGSDACGGAPDERSKQLRAGKPLQYPFVLSPFGTFDRQQTGTRTFDHNTSGLAHIGLLPDFVADLEVDGLAPKHLAPLLRSADAYIRMWERAEGKPIAPTCTCDPAGGAETCGVALPDGGVVVPPATDGGVVALPDGGVQLPDGGVVTNPDGGPVVVLPDGGVAIPTDDGGYMIPGDDAGTVLPFEDGGVSAMPKPDGGPGGEEVPKGCGCTTGEAHALWLAALALFGRVRRRARAG